MLRRSILSRSLLSSLASKCRSLQPEKFFNHGRRNSTSGGGGRRSNQSTQTPSSFFGLTFWAAATGVPLAMYCLEYTSQRSDAEYIALKSSALDPLSAEEEKIALERLCMLSTNVIQWPKVDQHNLIDVFIHGAFHSKFGDSRGRLAAIEALYKLAENQALLDKIRSRVTAQQLLHFAIQGLKYTPPAALPSPSSPASQELKPADIRTIQEVDALWTAYVGDLAVRIIAFENTVPDASLLQSIQQLSRASSSPLPSPSPQTSSSNANNGSDAASVVRKRIAAESLCFFAMSEKSRPVIKQWDALSTVLSDLEASIPSLRGGREDKILKETTETTRYALSQQSGLKPQVDKPEEEPEALYVPKLVTASKTHISNRFFAASIITLGYSVVAHGFAARKEFANVGDLFKASLFRGSRTTGILMFFLTATTIVDYFGDTILSGLTTQQAMLGKVLAMNASSSPLPSFVNQESAAPVDKRSFSVSERMLLDKEIALYYMGISAIAKSFVLFHVVRNAEFYLPSVIATIMSGKGSIYFSAAGIGYRSTARPRLLLNK